MKIHYKKTRLYGNLIIGLLWIGIGTFSFIENEMYRWYEFIYLLVGITYLFMFAYEFSNQYLTIKNGTLQLNVLFENKKVQLKDVKDIISFGNSYILKTDNKSIRINTKVIDKTSLIKLNDLLKDVKVDWK